MTQPLQYDGPLGVAVGKSRWETSWKNTETTWGEFAERLSHTQVTHETHGEFLKMKKPRQDEVKDVGAYVAGYINNGRRKSGNILNRSALTLDLDYAIGQEWDDLVTLFGFAAVMYSTHKHTPDKQRLRLVIPLAREVSREEYEPIARRVADWLGIDAFDDTTYQPERLMYWPSTSKDGEFFYRLNDGPWLSADEVLGSYKQGWEDSSQWPTSSRTAEIIRRYIKKQDDPLEKTGIIGAFCRTYDIHQAIETFLPDVYEATSDDNRYTYREGSTSGGLIAYEDKYAYSHHGTDPISGKLCNSFDLVRLHKFGIKDEDAPEGTPINRLPSFTYMKDFARTDKKTSRTIVDEQFIGAVDAFANVDFQPDEPETGDSEDWKDDLEVDKKGVAYGSITNLVLLLLNDPNLKGRMAFDDFEQREIVLKELPWRKVGIDRYMKDADVANIKHYLKKNRGMDTSVGAIEEALQVAFEVTKVNPVLDYLNGCVWDGVPRLDTLLVDYLGAEDSEYTRAVTRKTLTAAVARAFRPGTKFDNMLTLVGKQGIGKSTLVSKLGGPWFTDTFSFNMLGKKESYEQLQGAWLIEVGEMAGLKKAEVEAAKSFITSTVDRYRVSYGRRVSHFPRQCVFFGSTNNETFLRDTTGNRRFWPVTVGVTEAKMKVFKDLTASEIGQIWAEAVKFYTMGEPLFLPPKLEALANQVQADHTEVDDRTGAIQEFLEIPLPAGWADKTTMERRDYLSMLNEFKAEGSLLERQTVCAPEIWCECFGQNKAGMTAFNVKFIHEILRNMKGWRVSKSRLKFPNYGQQIGYERIEIDLTADQLLRFGSGEN